MYVYSTVTMIEKIVTHITRLLCLLEINTKTTVLESLYKGYLIIILALKRRGVISTNNIIGWALVWKESSPVKVQNVRMVHEAPVDRFLSDSVQRIMYRKIQPSCNTYHYWIGTPMCKPFAR